MARFGSDKPLHFWSTAPRLMAEPDELKKETVRIELPLPPVTKRPEAIAKSPETVPIQLPVRETGNPPIPTAFPSGPKEKTVRIPLMSESLLSSQKETQPLAAPQVAPQNLPVGVAPADKSLMLLYWALLGVSVLILIIQIWIYFS